MSTNDLLENENEQIRIGRVYKLTSSNCDKCYIGSSKSPYVSIRLAHHRQHHRKGDKDYQGLYDNGDPDCEILETIEFKLGEEWRLREREQFWSDENKDNRINIRKCYLSPEQKKEQRDIRIKKYHQSEKGKLSTRKANINFKLKYNQNVSPIKRRDLLDELEEINNKQQALRASPSLGLSS